MATISDLAQPWRLTEAESHEAKVEALEQATIHLENVKPFIGSEQNARELMSMLGVLKTRAGDFRDRAKEAREG